MTISASTKHATRIVSASTSCDTVHLLSRMEEKLHSYGVRVRDLYGSATPLLPWHKNSEDCQDLQRSRQVLSTVGPSRRWSGPGRLLLPGRLVTLADLNHPKPEEKDRCHHQGRVDLLAGRDMRAGSSNKIWRQCVEILLADG